MKSNVRALLKIVRYLRYIVGKSYKRALVLLFLLLLLGSVFELLGISAILPFVQAMIAPDELLQNQYIQYFVPIIGLNHDNVAVITGIGIIILYLTKNAFLIFSAYYQVSFETRVQKDLSVKMVKAFLSRPYTFFLTTSTAEVGRATGSDISGVYYMLSDMLTLMSTGLNIAFIAIYLFYTDVYIAVGVFFMISVLSVGIIAGIKPIMKSSGKKNLVARTKQNKLIYQIVNGIKEIFVMQRMKQFADAYDEAAEDVRITQRNYSFVNACPDRLIEGLCVSGIIGIVCIRLGMSDDLLSFVPKLSVFAMAAFKVLPSVGKVTSRIGNMIYVMPQVENCYECLRSADEYQRSLADVVKEQEDERLKKVVFQNVLSVKNVAWKYENKTNYVLTDVNIDIRKGEAVAFIGESGAGKTTLSDIVMGLFRPENGSIQMDGIDVYSMPKRWSQLIGYVPQSVFLIDDTVRMNVTFGDEDDDERIWDALRRAQLYDFVKSLPKGLDTLVGERGVRFSGGQRQRIAIARALYSNPEILVLDEATASLDNETEAAVMESIDALQGKITMIIVAHRLSTIRNCDKIYRIINGMAVWVDKDDLFGTEGMNHRREVDIYERVFV